MKPIGYTYLNDYYDLLLPKLGVEVYQDPNSEKEKLVDYGAGKRRILPGHLKYLDEPFFQMHSAIKYQGIRLHFFSAIFKKIDVSSLTNFISEQPNSQYNRVLWFLYEWLTGQKLNLPNLKSGNYIRLLDDNYYYTLKEGVRDARTRIVNNLLGTPKFCPTIRKTKEILELAKVDVYKTAYSKMQAIGDYLSVDLIGRSVNYLYTKETKSSTEIEKEQPDKQRMQRFLNAIKNVGLYELSKSSLIKVQNQIVADTAKALDYRTSEIYVGTTIRRFGFHDEDVHYVGAKQKQVESMMDGLFKLHDNLMLDGTTPPLMHATLISFGKVYIHPFEDGNGRLHRYLIHDVMKQREPKHRFIIPISAAILKNTKRYDEVLEVVSRPIMAMLDYEFDSQNKLIVKNDIDYMYRYPDYTEHVKFIYEMMNAAISDELIKEVCLLVVFDGLKKLVNKNVDLPNQKIDLLLSILISNQGKVSKRKRELFEKDLPESLIEELEITAKKLIGDMRKQFNIDVAQMMTSTQNTP